MRLAVMQPYFLPYLGYFQLIRAVDAFVIYDNIQFVKKGWIHRNRFLLNGSDVLFSLPLKADSDYLDVDQRQLAPGFATEKEKILRRIEGAYHKAPQFETAMPVVRDCFACSHTNLFQYVFHSIQTIVGFLDLRIPIHISSSLDPAPQCKGQERVLNICQTLHASHYINPPGGKALYDGLVFGRAGIKLSFIRPRIPEYCQFDHPFFPNLSIVDVMMFNSVEKIRSMLDSFDLELAS